MGRRLDAFADEARSLADRLQAWADDNTAGNLKDATDDERGDAAEAFADLDEALGDAGEALATLSEQANIELPPSD